MLKYVLKRVVAAVITMGFDHHRVFPGSSDAG